MRVKRIAQAVGAMTLAPLLVLATSVAAHADSDVHWTHKPDNKCLEPGCNWAGAPDDVAVHSCHNTVAFWRDVHQSDGSSVYTHERNDGNVHRLWS